jgi:hypothetical protein
MGKHFAIISPFSPCFDFLSILVKPFIYQPFASFSTSHHFLKSDPDGVWHVAESWGIGEMVGKRC